MSSFTSDQTSEDSFSQPISHRIPNQKSDPSPTKNTKSMRDAKSYRDPKTTKDSKSHRDSKSEGSSGCSHGRQYQSVQDSAGSNALESPYSRFLHEFRSRYGDYYSHDQVTKAAEQRWCDMALNHGSNKRLNGQAHTIPNALNARACDDHRAAYSYAGMDLDSGAASTNEFSFGGGGAGDDDGQCGKKKASKVCKTKPKKAKPSCPKPKPKCSKPKPMCRKPKPKNPCRRAPACPKKPKPKCAKAKPKCSKPKKAACPKKC